MGWEKRRNGLYYYRVRRVGGRVVKEYIGGGAKGRQAAEEDEVARRIRAAAVVRRREYERSLAALKGELREFADLLDDVTTYSVQCAGWRLHHRQWRPPNVTGRRSGQTR